MLDAAKLTFGFRDMLFLAGKVARGLRQPRLQLCLAGLGARFLAFQRIALDAQAMQHRGARRLLVAQRLKLLGGFGLLTQRLALSLGFLGDHAECRLKRGLFLLHMGAGRHPMQMMLQGLGLADLSGNLAVALRLAGLALQRLQLRGELADQVAEALKIGFRGLEAKLGLMPSAMQAGNARGILQHAAPLLRGGIDDLADTALAHQRRRARTGRRVLEQQADVARPRILAVDPVGRADFALDAPRHLKVVGVVELGRCRARAIVDEQRHLGGVAGRPVLRAGEDHVVHGRAAHALIGGLAHGPAQRLEQVRLAAAVRPDHAGESRLDQDFGRLDKGFEAEKAKTGDLQLRIALGPGRSDARFNASAAPQDQVDDCGPSRALNSSKVMVPCALRPLAKKVGVPTTPNFRPRCFTSVSPSIMV